MADAKVIPFDDDHRSRGSAASRRRGAAGARAGHGRPPRWGGPALPGTAAAREDDPVTGEDEQPRERAADGEGGLEQRIASGLAFLRRSPATTRSTTSATTRNSPTRS